MHRPGGEEEGRGRLLHEMFAVGTARGGRAAHERPLVHRRSLSPLSYLSLCGKLALDPVSPDPTGDGLLAEVVLKLCRCGAIERR